MLGADAVARARDGLLQLELAPRERLERGARLIEVARPEPVEDLELQLLLRLELRGRDGARGLAAPRSTSGMSVAAPSCARGQPKRAS